MSAAWAAEAAAAGGHAEAFHQTPEFWVFVAFVMLIGATAKAVYAKITAALDMRAENIKEQIDEAAKLCEEAQAMLADFERKQHDAAGEAKTIVERAQAEASRLTEQAAKDLEKSLARREQLARERIAQVEANAIDEVRTMAVNAAVEAVRKLLSENIPEKRASSMIDDAIKELPEKLN